MTSATFAAFLAAQEPIYDRVLRELAAGHKESHWMWFIFPQLAGLGSSAMAQEFALQRLATTWPIPSSARGCASASR